MSSSFFFDSFFKESEGTYGNYIYKNGNPSDGLLKTLPVARNIEGRIFVMPTNADGYDINANNFVLKESGAFHICQVLQATDPDRLAEKSKGGSFEEIEREFEGQGYGAFKPAGLINGKDHGDHKPADGICRSRKILIRKDGDCL